MFKYDPNVAPIIAMSLRRKSSFVRSLALQIINRATLETRALKTRAFKLRGRGLLAASLACFSFIFSSSSGDLVPLHITLPPPIFMDWIGDHPLPPDVEKPTGKPHPPLMVPPGVSNVALGKTVTSSATNAPPKILAKITDGNKESNEPDIVLLGAGVQWVQIDLGRPQEIYGIGIWRSQYPPRACHGIVVQFADNTDFTKNIHTLLTMTGRTVTDWELGPTASIWIPTKAK